MKQTTNPEKACIKCNVVKPISEFHRQVQRGKNGEVWPHYDGTCKMCRLSYHSRRRRLVKERAIAYLGGKCVDCGYCEPFPEVYDFHHLDKTKKDFSVFGNLQTFEKILPEIEKCVLLCANCHRKRHSRWNEDIVQ